MYNPANNTLLNTTCYVYNGSSAIATYTKQASETTYHGEYSVHGMGRITTYNDDEQRYHYEINDHLGNVRAVISRNAAGNLEVLQATDYYPWGMEMPGRQQVASHAYRYGYQGQFAEKDEATGMNHFELRQYDAALGRWFAPDPYRQHHSPYMAMGNNWPNGVDPDGGWEITIFGITIKYTKHKHNVGNGRGHWDIDCSWSISSGGAAPDYGSCSLSDFDFSWAGYSGYSSSYDGSVYSSGYGGGGDYDYDQDDYHSNNNDGVDGHITHMKQQIEDGRLFPFATLQDDGEALQEQFARDRIKGNDEKWDRPIIVVNIQNKPSNFIKDKYRHSLYNKLVNNGVSDDLTIFFEEDLTWIENLKIDFFVPSEFKAEITIRNPNRNDKPGRKGGFATPFSMKAVVYSNLDYSSHQKFNFPMWQYANASAHELGHAIWGFPDVGHNGNKNSLIDYDGVTNPNANFTEQEQISIKNSKWGRK